MIILFPVPLWFVIAGLLVSVAFVIYEMIEDAEIVADARHAREAADRAHEAQRPELDRLQIKTDATGFQFGNGQQILNE